MGRDRKDLRFQSMGHGAVRQKAKRPFNFRPRHGKLQGVDRVDRADSCRLPAGHIERQKEWQGVSGVLVPTTCEYAQPTQASLF